jgi:hypothetical protein
MRIQKFNRFILELHQMENILPLNQIYNMIFRDKTGEYLLSCKLIEHGWSLHREIIYYRFEITKSDSNFYRIGGEFIVSTNFNKKENMFNFFPFYNETGSNKLRSMEKKRCSAYIEIL